METSRNDNILVLRLSFLIFLALSIGIAFSYHIDLGKNLNFFLLMASTISFILSNGEVRQRIFLFFVFFFLADSLMAFRQLDPEEEILYSGEVLILSREKEGEDYSTYIAKREDSGERLYISMEDGPYKIGDKIHISSKMNRGERAKNPYFFDSYNYFRSRDIGWSGFVEEGASIKIGENKSPSLKIKRAFYDNLDRAFSSFRDRDQRDLMLSLVTSRSLREEKDLEFRKLGLSHLLAISGLQIQILKVLVISILVFFGFNRFRAEGLSLFLIFFYSWLLDFPYPVLRVFISSAISFICHINFENEDRLTSLFSSSLIILLLNPYALFNLGFQLSTLSSLALIFSNRIYLPIKNGEANSSIRTSLSIQAFILPLQITNFNRINFLLILANLLIVPIFSLLTYSAFAILFLSPFLDFFPRLIASFLSPILRSVFLVVEFLSSIDLFEIEMASLSMAKILSYYFFLYLFINRDIFKDLSFRKKAFLLSNLSLLLFIRSFYLLLFPAISLSFISIGQGDSAILTYKDQAYLFDTGGSPFEGEKRSYEILKRVLESRGIKEIDGLFISHADKDHVGNFEKLEGDFEIKKLFLSDRVAQDLGIGEGSYVRISEGDILKNCAFEIEILKSDGNGEKNDYSSVEILDLGFRVLMTGDIEKEGEESLLDEDIRADILKVPHHGSSTSSSETFIKKVRPKIAVISVGKNNPYGHPDPLVVKSYEDMGVDVFRTDRDGMIIFKTNGLSSSIEKTVYGRMNPEEFLSNNIYGIFTLILYWSFLYGLYLFYFKGENDELYPIDEKNRRP